MQDIILYIIMSFLFGIITSNFMSLSQEKNGEDFTVKEYFKNFKLRIDLKYIITYFIILVVVVGHISLNSFLYIPLCFALILAMIMDIKYMIIPDTSSVIILILGILNIAINFQKEEIILKFFGMIFAGATLFLIDFVFGKITNQEGFGMGDMKLLSSIGLFVGYKSVAVIMILSVIISAIFGIVYVFFDKTKSIKNSYIPLAPSIVISTFIICIVPATSIISWYIYFIDMVIEKIN